MISSKDLEVQTTNQYWDGSVLHPSTLQIMREYLGIIEPKREGHFLIVVVC